MARVSDVMTTEVYETSAETSVVEVASAMVSGRIGSALVTTGSMLLGIFTERDVLRAAASGDDLASSPVSAWMTKDPDTVSTDLDTDGAAEQMLTNGYRHLPVVDGAEALVGIVSLRDVLSARIGRR